MTSAASPGRVVILNGTSSSGKTSLATGLAERRAAHGEMWIVIGIDDYLAKVPASWFEGGSVTGPYAHRGVRFVSPTAGETTLELGVEGRRLLAAYRRSVTAAVRTGLDVLVDDVIIDEPAWRDWCDALEDLDVVWVAVRCSDEVVARREAGRGDRYVGLARSQAREVHRFPPYAIDIDTTALTVDEGVDALDRALTERWQVST
ncbi:MAG TPA: AAA family ATPase [Acidimicrobiales bacterium]|jgi:chloramphenicol 3-O phosphotransferase